jgi:tetratricopeptide (TPR) repeat protein
MSTLEELTQYLYKNNKKKAAIDLLDNLGDIAFSFSQNDDIAKCYFKLKEYKKSILFAENAFTLSSSIEELDVSRSNLINVYNHANYPELALRYLNQQKYVDKYDNHALLEESYSYFLLNKKDKAEEILHYVLNNVDNLTDEERIKIKFNLGTYYMYKDKFQQGLKLFLLEGKKLDFWQFDKLPYKFWEGGIQPGKQLVLHAEAGIGDEVVNIRFMKHLEELGMIPIWHTDRIDLAEVFKRNGFRVITSLNVLKNTQDVLWTFPMCLPIYLNLQYKDLWYGPYLTAKNTNQFQWIEDQSYPKIGVRWQGNPEYDQDLHRSIPLKEIYESVKHINANFYSLQRDIGLEELMDFPKIVDMEYALKNWESTIEIISKLDIVITSCTSIAHVAAALGKITYVIVPISAYYTWCHSMEQTPWYGNNVKIFRQVKTRSWEEPLVELKKCINEILL